MEDGLHLVFLMWPDLVAGLQVRLLCVTDQFGAWANETAQRMRESGLRVEVSSAVWPLESWA